MILPRIFTVFTAYLTPSGKIYHNRGDFFCAKQQQNEKPEQQWRKFRRIEKVLEFKNITFTELTVSKFITSFTVTKVREAIPDETENTLTLVMNRKKNKQCTINRKKNSSYQEPKQRMEIYSCEKWTRKDNTETKVVLL